MITAELELPAEPEVACEPQRAQASDFVAASSDTIAASVVVMLGMMVLQRLAGFLRGVLFCRWLDPEQLGQWDVAFGFLMLAAPLAVLGLPGSFGRYLEHFRQRRQLRMFLARTTALSTVMAIGAVVAVSVHSRWFSEQIFGHSRHTSLVTLLALSLGAVILHNFLVSLFIAVRTYRAVSGLQFYQAVLFTIIGLVLVSTWRKDAGSIVVAFGIASLLSAALYLPRLWHVWNTAPSNSENIPQATFWARLMPFAVWIWVTNLLSNLFELIDRYMIVHYSGLSEAEALVQVGHYHSSRIVPMLFVSVAMLLSSMITPHLSHDWETGRKKLVSSRLNLTLKLLGLALLAGSICVLWTAPLLFDVALQGKFSGGLAVLPLTLTYCSWFGLGAVAQNYLWCAEKARLSSLALLLGLVANVCLNLLLLPRFGLEGAVWSTSAANLIALTLFYAFSRRHGMDLDLGTWIISLSPAVLYLGAWPALVALVVILATAACSELLLTAAEKRQLTEAWLQLIDRARTLLAKRNKVEAIP